MGAISLAADGSVAETSPVGRPVANTPETGYVDEALQQRWANAVTGLEFCANLPARQCKHLGGEIAHLEPGPFNAGRMARDCPPRARAVQR